MTRTGLEMLIEREGASIEGQRIGLVANQTSITSDFRSSLNLLMESRGTTLAAVFSPEHGFYGEKQDMIPVEHLLIKGKKGSDSLPLISLYGKSEQSLKPHKKYLDLLDVLLFDIQDIGSRYYTYISTMSYCMEACAEHQKKMIILDRPNPINGRDLEGPILEKSFSSFVGRYPIPIRHGMTSGELATFFNYYYGMNCDLKVIKMNNWKRDMWFDETELPWIPPSPNIPTLHTALIYPGTCLIEGTNLSEGRGTCHPFEWIGAPWIQAEPFAEWLNQYNLPGVYFRPIHFTPQFHKWKEERCQGVHIHLTDRKRYRPVLTGVAIVSSAYHLYPDQFRWREEPYEFAHEQLAFDLLAGSEQLREQITSKIPLDEIASSWKADCEKFEKFREKFLLY